MTPSNPAFGEPPSLFPRIFPAVDFHDRTEYANRLIQEFNDKIELVQDAKGVVTGAGVHNSAVGVKFDLGKPKMSLIDSGFLIGLAEVLTFGALKYEAHNWRKGMPVSRLYDALQRHLVAFNSGEDLDPESGKSHLFHAACCLMFLTNMMSTRPDLDDRYTTE